MLKSNLGSVSENIISKIKRVIILGLDGIGNSPKITETPNIHRIFNQGLYTYNGRTEFPPISGQCWGTIFHGVLPDQHKLTNDVAYYHTWPNNSSLPSIFRLVRQKFPNANLATFSNWAPINTGILESNLGIHFHTGTDEEMASGLMKYVRDNDVKLLYLDLDDCDHAGHSRGFFTKDYFKQLQKTDRQVGEILDVIETKKWFDDSLIMVVTDHGGGGLFLTEHGYNFPQDMTVCFGCCGPLIPHKEIKNFRIRDIPSIAISSLGIEKPSFWMGRTISEVLQD